MTCVKDAGCAKVEHGYVSKGARSDTHCVECHALSDDVAENDDKGVDEDGGD